MATSTPAVTAKTSGLLFVDYPKNQQTAVLGAAKAWQLFCSLPKQTKQAFTYVQEAKSSAGFELKEEAGASRDLKENFHYTLEQTVRLAKIARQTRDPIATQFIYQNGELMNMLHPLVMEFARQLETQYSISGLAEEVLAGKDGWTLRYLHYFGNRRAGEAIATPHTDKCGFTLHLTESDSGLQHLTYPGKVWEAMPINPSQTTVIPGMQLQFRSHNELIAPCHQVVATDKTASEGRYSIVCFIGLPQTPAIQKAKTGRMQDRQPGFNYDISWEDFSTLFQ